MFTDNQSMFEIILSRLSSVDHLVAKEGTIFASAIHNEEDVARRRNVRSITDHVITSIFRLKWTYQSANQSREIWTSEIQIVWLFIEKLIKLSRIVDKF